MPDQRQEYEYYVTISPNPRKFLGTKCYSAHTDVRQICYIYDTVCKSVKWCSTSYVPEIYFEYNKRLMIHAHLRIKATPHVMSQIQKNINNKLGSHKLSPEICCHLCPSELWKPKDNPSTGAPYESWYEYCRKDDPVSRLVRCECIKCKVKREDKVIIDAIEHGDIELSLE